MYNKIIKFNKVKDMAVHTFSTRDETRPKDEALVQDIKDLCNTDYRLNNFSSVVIEALAKWKTDYESRNNSATSGKDRA